ncbi:RhoGEF domain containing protein [Balamuthia mandrillaris]
MSAISSTEAGQEKLFSSLVLPDSIVLHIFSWLKPSELCRISLVEKKWNKLASSNTLWKAFFHLAEDRAGPEEEGQQKNNSRRSRPASIQRTVSVLSEQPSPDPSPEESLPASPKEKRSVQVVAAVVEEEEERKTVRAPSGTPVDDWKKFYRMSWKRTKIAREIYESEKTYVTRLQTVVEVFINPFREMEENRSSKEESSNYSSSAILTKEERKLLFSELEVILGYQEELLSNLTLRIESWSLDQRLGDIFKNMVTFLKVYTSYVNQFNQAITLLANLKTRPDFKAVLSYMESKKRCNRQTLNSFLIMPVQRIPRYVLLLQDLFKHTYPGHPDRQDLNLALNKMLELAEYIDKKKEEADLIHQLMTVQECLVGYMEPIVVPGRRYCYEGNLSRLVSSSTFAASLPSSKKLRKAQNKPTEDAFVEDKDVNTNRRMSRMLQRTGSRESFGNVLKVSRAKEEQLLSPTTTSLSEDERKSNTKKKGEEEEERLLLQLGRRIDYYCFLFTDVLMLAKRNRTTSNKYHWSTLRKKLRTKWGGGDRSNNHSPSASPAPASPSSHSPSSSTPTSPHGSNIYQNSPALSGSGSSVSTRPVSRSFTLGAVNPYLHSSPAASSPTSSSMIVGSSPASPRREEADGRDGDEAPAETYHWEQSIPINSSCIVIENFRGGHPNGEAKTNETDEPSDEKRANSFGFKLVSPDETYQFVVTTEEEQKAWVQALQSTINALRKADITAKRRSLILLTPAIKKEFTTSSSTPTSPTSAETREKRKPFVGSTAQRASTTLALGKKGHVRSRSHGNPKELSFIHHQHQQQEEKKEKKLSAKQQRKNSQEEKEKQNNKEKEEKKNAARALLRKSRRLSRSVNDGLTIRNSNNLIPEGPSPLEEEHEANNSKEETNENHNKKEKLSTSPVFKRQASDGRLLPTMIGKSKSHETLSSSASATSTRATLKEGKKEKDKKTKKKKEKEKKKEKKREKEKKSKKKEKEAKTTKETNTATSPQSPYHHVEDLTASQRRQLDNKKANVEQEKLVLDNTWSI